ncbi:DUF3592 domain-containing protein [Dapis sp. BLCC M229]|uniref:DUF3592 domain-containing protein n=1 Tax=Dapis sp. BLCC M229 TaxID=3400188 RepID=UPI003CF23CBF
MLTSIQTLTYTMSKLFFPLFISIFFAVGFGMLGYGINSAKKSVEVSNWPSVTGTITNMSLRESSDSDGTTYGVEVEYRYSVMGRTYTGSRLAFGYISSSGRQAHQDILNKLESASSVKVRYSPQNPATSTLSFGIHRSIKFVLAFAITWLAFVFGFTLIWWIASQPDDVLLKNLEVTLKR